MHKIELTSTAFAEGGTFPKKYTADGENVSPPLKWSDPPQGTRSFALVCEDPDAPGGTWVHWVVFNLPTESRSLEVAVSTEETLQDGAKQGKNDFKKIGYGGPAPPSGTHRYYFKLYALDRPLDLAAGANREELQRAMKDHVLGGGQLMGRYGR
jgi:Raf kinase inhibitor-like YbhB/YbcL family protein